MFCCNQSFTSNHTQFYRDWACKSCFVLFKLVYINLRLSNPISKVQYTFIQTVSKTSFPSTLHTSYSLIIQIIWNIEHQCSFQLAKISTNHQRRTSITMCMRLVKKFRDCNWICQHPQHCMNRPKEEHPFHTGSLITRRLKLIWKGISGGGMVVCPETNLRSSWYRAHECKVY